MKPYVIPLKFHHLLQLSDFPDQRFFCNVISGALQSSESVKLRFHPFRRLADIGIFALSGFPAIST
ncbi:hypothetical protein NC651_032850 [Populus alba x Populus x berolinensis]|nr:hypothetical protein NC651_032850 [Populus alba x Populus x berolinensis]